MPTAVKFFPRLLRWFLIITVVIFALLIAKDILIKIAVEQVGTRMIGAELNVGSFSLDVFSRKMKLQNIRLHNPPGFPNDVFLVMPQVAVDIDLPQALKGQLHFPLIVFHMDKMVVIKNKQGKLNVDELKIVQEKMKEKSKGPLPNFKIDVLKLNIEKVIYEDENSGTPPIIQGYDLDLKDKTLRNINGVPQLVAAIMVEALKPTAIRSAGLFAAGALMGVGFLPGLAFGVVVADDDSSADINQSFDRTYTEAMKLVKELGSFKRQNKQDGQIFGKVYGCDIAIEIGKKGWGKSHVKIKARKYMLAKAQIAAGLLYQLKERLQ